MNTDNTTVETIDMEIDQLINADNIMLPSTEETKNTVFSRKINDLSYLNKDIKKEDIIDDPDKKKDADKKDDKISVSGTSSITDQSITDIINEGDETKSDKPSGRPSLTKNGLIELTNKLIEQKLLVPFDDDKKIEEYTAKDFEDLFVANVNEKEKKIRQEIPAEFFKSLPHELQYAAKYTFDGGTDLKGLFRTLAAVEEVKSLDPRNPADQKQIVRSYLQAINFGTPDEIEEEIIDSEDSEKLQEKALKFKPKLDNLSEKQVQYQLQHQEKLKVAQQEQAEIYMENVYRTLEPAELNGLKLDKKTQNSLFAGLVQPNYQSVSGKPTNLLGHLLEKYQFLEPNHALVAEALYLLSDPEGYRAKVKEGGKKEAITETIRSLKTEEKAKIASRNESDDDKKDKIKKDAITRPGKNFFKF